MFDLLPKILGGAICVVLFVLPLVSVSPDLSWHDQQRIGQVVIFLFSVILFWVFRCRRGDFYSRAFLLSIFFLSIVSCLHSSQVFWSFVELSVFFCCYIVVCCVCEWRIRCGEIVDNAVWWLLTFVIVGLLSKFFFSYFFAVVAREKIIVWFLFDGFSWPRFLGQFQTLSLPLLTVPMLANWRRRYWFFLLCSLWWFSTISVGTRASWLGMACAILLLPIFIKRGWLFSLYQGGTLVAGLGFYVVFFKLIPGFCGLQVSGLAEERLNMSLSGREYLWEQAWKMTMEHPWLGAGPMQYAALANLYGAHPHQAILQWTSEWGSISAVLVALLLLRLLWLLYLRSTGWLEERGSTGAIKICLLASFIASLAHAMFDGSLVMPYTQVWLSVLVGWAWGLVAKKDAILPISRAALSARRFFSMAFCSVLVFVIFRDVPGIIERNKSGVVSQTCWVERPRFWSAGIIKKLPESECASSSGRRSD
ncbi:O-antigen ligase family protein [Pseudomonas citronellolis]|uniref:O-antigen ligase family protein n=1 Tax=Pseudomonas citronellolis TaxID=53408 RepID=UPI0020A1F967|nr:O-antigen ligase family protein [Pseudomonas citronellolis]MCP1602812.1 O-antigen ligase [Pseudomonas citronellolis]MCP1653870.1 O-antigen ligase [Pseudomonas citronellolis]MCP1720816.1 O-antigen ligase [Pseudomonas citronellolis]